MLSLLGKQAFKFYCVDITWLTLGYRRFMPAHSAGEILMNCLCYKGTFVKDVYPHSGTRMLNYLFIGTQNCPNVGLYVNSP